MRKCYAFNHGWLYLPERAGGDVPNSAFEAVTVPHSNKILPYHNFDDAEYQFVSTYRKVFRLPEDRRGRRVFLDFEGVMLAATVTINGHIFPEHKGGYTPFSLDITDHLIEGDNLLVVHVDSTERPDIPPFGYVVDYLAFGGIYREVWLRYVEPCHIANVFIRPQDVLTTDASIEIDVTLRNVGAADASAMVQAELLATDGAALLAGEPQPVTVPAGGETVTTLRFDSLPEMTLWSMDNPALYGALVRLDNQGGGQDAVTERFGLREAVFREDGFYLNGQRVKLRGLNRHQTYPYIGAAAPARLQRKDADIIKHDMACHIVRTSHYPQSRHFLDRCDEIGLLVFEEIPGWQHIGDADWQAISLRDVRVMIERDRNRPSIVIWGVRINESLDNTEFYTATNRLAHELDPTRQTTGVRFWQHSEFLEDVYSFNDFSGSVQEPEQTPHLITEFAGHTFPTKTWDNEERRMQHALLHTRIQSRQINMGGVAGAIGWCAFDYNTHKEFGSGDRICYHGVMDMFRLPKYAAFVYASQISPQERVVMEPATMWTMDRSEGTNDPMFIFSNCDEIEVFIGDESLGRHQPDHDLYPGLPHPPFNITNLGLSWGQAFNDLRLVGYLNGEVAIERVLLINKQPHVLELTVDDSEISADGIDMTRVAFRVVDRAGNVMPYAIKVVTLEADGPADLIGDNPFPLVGGQGALYLRAGHETGLVRVRARADRLPDAEVVVMLK